MKTPFFAPRARRPRTLYLIAGATLVFNNALATPGPLRPRLVARSAMAGFAVIPLAADALRENERAFLGKAVESSRQQMRLATIGASRAASADVRSEALALAADFRDLTESLEALIRRKGGMAGAPVGNTSENYQKLADKAGADFDREFVRTTDALSSDIMTLFETATSDARDADVRDFAAAQLPTLRAHRNTLTDLKKSLP